MQQQSATQVTRVDPAKLQTFVYEAARKLTIADEQARLLSELLITNDLRGVLSHGSRQMRRYTREIRTGALNPTPDVQMVRESPTSLVMDGDGGLGYFPAYEGTLKVIEKAQQQGMAALVTKNHGHIGAAGIYSRMVLPHDMIAFCTSGVQLNLTPDKPVYSAAGGSPMSFSAPADKEPPLVLDVGVTHNVQHNAPQRDDLVAVAPAMVLRAVGYGTVCQAWGGLLAGLPIDANRADRKYAAANQGGMLYAVKISLFADPAEFKREMDEYAQRVRKLQPMPGSEGAFLPGHVEVQREKINREAGVPLSEAHLQDLQDTAAELDIQVPWL